MNEYKSPAVPAAAIPDEVNNLEADKSWGERLSPLLVIAMQACLIYTLLLVASGFLAGIPGPLLPIWAVCLVFFALYWFAGALRRSVTQWIALGLPAGLCRVLLRLIMGCAVLVSWLFCVWLRFYSPAFSLLNLTWWQALSRDWGEVDRDLQIALLGALLSALAWLSYRTVGEQSNAALLLNKGSMLMGILTSISLGEGLLRSSSDFWQTLLLLPVFFWLGLTAQALQKVSTKRRAHAVGLVDSTRSQERIIFQIMSLLGLIVCIAALVMLFVHGDLTVHIPRANPFLGFIPPISSNPLKMPPPKYYGEPGDLPHISIPLVQSMAALSTLGICIVGIFILSMLSISLYLWLKYRKKRVRHKGWERDERKSLWKWSLFLAQCGALLCTLLALLHLLHRKPKTDGSRQSNGLLLEPSEVRNVREVYRAFLQKATRQGYAREKHETPDEFRYRLREQEPLLEPELGTITEAYALVRYGGTLPRADEISRVYAHWRALDHKWPITEKASVDGGDQ